MDKYNVIVVDGDGEYDETVLENVSAWWGFHFARGYNDRGIEIGCEYRAKLIPVGIAIPQSVKKAS